MTAVIAVGFVLTVVTQFVTVTAALFASLAAFGALLNAIEGKCRQ